MDKNDKELEDNKTEAEVTSTYDSCWDDPDCDEHAYDCCSCCCC